MKCLFNDALKPAAYMPNFTLAARSRAQFTMNSWKTGCGMEEALGQPANSCPGCRLAGHPGQQKSLSGALPPRCTQCLGSAAPWELLHPLRTHQERGEGGSGLWQQGLLVFGMEEQCHSSQHR